MEFLLKISQIVKDYIMNDVVSEKVKTSSGSDEETSQKVAGAEMKLEKPDLTIGE